jgi:hypothetical protein
VRSSWSWKLDSDLVMKGDSMVLWVIIDDHWW